MKDFSIFHLIADRLIPYSYAENKNIGIIFYFEKRKICINYIARV